MKLTLTNIKQTTQLTTELCKPVSRPLNFSDNSLILTKIPDISLFSSQVETMYNHAFQQTNVRVQNVKVAL